MSCGCNQENYGRECERNYEERSCGERVSEERGGCDRRNYCQQAIRRVERDTRELVREIEEVEKKACQLRRDVENLNGACARWENSERPCGCQRPCGGCGCQRPCGGCGCQRPNPRPCGCGR
ncbi:MAG: hypothetical protein RR324_03015 [Cellulosilyticaceae bacterium]